jgi:hypothetical protein
MRSSGHLVKQITILNMAKMLQMNGNNIYQYNNKKYQEEQ